MGLQSLGGPSGSGSSGELCGRRPLRREEEEEVARGAPRGGGPLAPPAPRLAGRVSRMWRWCAAGGAGGGPTGVSVTSGDRKVVAAPRLTHRSRGMAPLSRDDAASAPAPEWAGGAGEWRAPPVAPPLPAGDEPPWEECAGLGNRLEGPAWLALLDDDRDGDDDDGCCSIRQSASCDRERGGAFIATPDYPTAHLLCLACPQSDENDTR